MGATRARKRPTSRAGGSSSRRRRAVAAVGVAILAVPVTAGSAFAVPPRPAVAGSPAAHAHAVDQHWYIDPFGRGLSQYLLGLPSLRELFGGSTHAATGSSATRVASARESRGLVEITNTVDFGSGRAMGTGMVIRSDGIVVTNHHVVKGSTHLKVRVVSTGRTYKARVLGYDSKHDIAVLKLVGASNLDLVKTDSSGVSVGERVVSVGDAGGDGGALTAAPGRVGDERRTITVSDDDGGHSRLRGVIEVNADIQAGDSGGALYDSSDDVIGMNVAASSGSANVTGFAIPIARVLRVADRILAHDGSGSVELGYTAFLGVDLASGTSPQVSGVVRGSGAASAGIVAGDTIVAIDGTHVSTADQLRAAIASHRPGATVTVTWRDWSGAQHSADATLTRGPLA